MRRKIRKWFELNDNEHTTYKNVWPTDKAEFRGKCLALYAYIGKAERPKAYPLRSKGNKLDIDHKIIRRKEIKMSEDL